MLRRLNLVCIALGLFTLLSVAALAQNTEPSKYVEKGNSLFQTGDTDGALAQYVLAYSHEQTPDNLLNIARVFSAKNMTSVARALFQRVLDTAPQSQAANDAQKELVTLNSKNDSTQPLTLTVIPPGATVIVDGNVVGKAPIAPVQLTVGPHKLTIQMAGYVTVTQSLQITSGAPATRVITLQPGESSVSETANLQITKLPPGAKATVNNQPVLVGPNGIATSEVTPGLYTVRVIAPGTPVFVRTINVASGTHTVEFVSNATVQNRTAARNGPSTSLVGQWVGHEMPDASEDRRNRSARLEMSSETSGTLVLEESMLLPRWKQKQCDGAQNVSWKARYSVRLEPSTGGGRLVGTKTRIECSCSGQCRADDSVSLDVLIPKNHNTILNNRYVFQRMRGSTSPVSPNRKSPSLNGLTGNWSFAWGKLGKMKIAKAVLQGGAKEFTGTMSLPHTMQLQRWRRKDCNGQSEMEATHHYKISGRVDGDLVKVEFRHDKYTDCPCSESICQTAAAVIAVPEQSFYMTLDGSALISQDAIISKLP
jgi:hypothetical protein